MHPLEKCLTDLSAIANVGVKETSGYPMLEELFNAAGENLTGGRVTYVAHPSSAGAGLPDGGLFTEEQQHGVPIR